MTDNKPVIGAALLGVLLGLGIAVAAGIFGNAFIRARAGDRFVSVKGLAEREVDADLAIWPITFTETGNDLGSLQKAIDAKRDVVTAFLRRLGFTAAEISQAAPKIRDTQTETYGTKSETRYRYIAQITVLLRSENVARVKEAMEEAGTLVGQGVALASDWQGRTEFLFKGLNKIKPEMIEEATTNARSAAEKFAKDSGSRIGKIRNASQGLFSITDRDMNSPDRKNVRVVTTVEYYLIDE